MTLGRGGRIARVSPRSAFWLWGTGSRFRGVSSDTLVQVIDLLR